MRGAQRSLYHIWDPVGIIPAYAGSTGYVFGCWLSHWDHPRVCGEHSALFTRTVSRSGSSPRMRGAPIANNLLIYIPRDHPRVCGEHASIVGNIAFETGSSPRMRGAPIVQCENASKFGIIPAYAGSTAPTRWRRSATRDHPRVCGEHYLENAEKTVWSGSSPRMRGALCIHTIGGCTGGIIPAYAGST